MARKWFWWITDWRQSPRYHHPDRTQLSSSLQSPAQRAGHCHFPFQAVSWHVCSCSLLPGPWANPPTCCSPWKHLGPHTSTKPSLSGEAVPRLTSHCSPGLLRGLKEPLWKETRLLENDSSCRGVPPSTRAQGCAPCSHSLVLGAPLCGESASDCDRP